jgi:MYXO-CTERM domain-containing protein
VTGGLFNDGWFQGNGRLTADVTNAGVFRPDADRQTVVEGRFIQTAAGELRQSVRESAPATLVVNGDVVDLAGTITLTPFNQSRAGVGDRFFLIDTDAPIQYSASITSPIPQFRFEPLIVPGEGLYAVLTAVPEPSFAGLMAVAGALTLRRRRDKNSPK